MGYRGAVNKEYTSAINDCQAQRFSVSSNPTIKTAVSHWEPFAFEHGLELLVENGDPNRGGVMASFALYLARKNSRMEKFNATFAWGLEQHHINNGKHSPLDNVQGWARWMRALEVQIYTPARVWLSRALESFSYTRVSLSLGVLVALFAADR